MLDCPLHRRPARRSKGFTLIELLVVIGIIIVLISILLPVVSMIRRKGDEANTRNFVNQLGTAIERYQQDFRAYPGPLANNEMDLAEGYTGYHDYNTILSYEGFTKGLYITPNANYDTSPGIGATAADFTMPENLVLGLLGGMHVDSTDTTQLDYDPTAVGGGPASLSRIGPPKRYPPYLDSKNLSWRASDAASPNGTLTGHFWDESGDALDTMIPCFIDTFTNPMPILYMRAKVGVNLTAGAVTGDTDYGDNYNPIVTDDFSEKSAPLTGSSPQAYAQRAGAYDISQIIAYTAPYTGTWPNLTRDSNWPPKSGAGNTPTGRSIGIGKSSPRQYTFPGANQYHGLFMSKWTSLSAPPPSMTNGSTTYVYPYDAYPYLIGQAGGVRQKDSYILISAGADRIYGTDDDICNFGTVGQ